MRDDDNLSESAVVRVLRRSATLDTHLGRLTRGVAWGPSFNVGFPLSSALESQKSMVHALVGSMPAAGWSRTHSLSERHGSAGASARIRWVAQRAFAICFLAALFAIRPVHAQERAVLRATVVDSRARPVAGATIRTSSPAMVASTDSAGRVALAFGHGERVSVVISKIGFAAETVYVSFLGRAVVDTVILFDRAAVVLATVRVKSEMPQRYLGIARYEDFYERRRMAVGGTFFDRAQLDRLGSIAWALNTVPGVRAFESAGRVGARFARCPSGRIAVVIDGIYLPSVSMGQIRSDEVETLEVYTGVAQLPAVARGDACAAVIMTTRMVRTLRDSNPED